METLTIPDKIEQETIAAFLETGTRYSNVGIPVSGGKDSEVVAILAKKFTQFFSSLTFFSVMTNYKFVETFSHLRYLNDALNLNLQVFIAYDEEPKIFRGSGIKTHLLPNFYETFQEENSSNQILGAKRCCELLKVMPFQFALDHFGFDAWISGTRKSEGGVRKDFTVFQENRGRMMVSPILEWERDKVFAFIKREGFKVNELYERGYISLGCQPCTRIPRPGEDERTCRFRNREEKECELCVDKKEFRRKLILLLKKLPGH